MSKSKGNVRRAAEGVRHARRRDPAAVGRRDRLLGRAVDLGRDPEARRRGYRRIRNTLRFLLANTSDFDRGAARDAGRRAGSRSTATPSRWRPDSRRSSRRTTTRYEFHLVVQRLQTYCSEDLGGFYLDVLKDRLYTAAQGFAARALGAERAAPHPHSLLRLMAPMLSFTAEEAWQVLTGRPDDSVFFHTWHAFPQVPDAPALLERWREIRAARPRCRRSSRRCATAGEIGSSLAGGGRDRRGGRAVRRARAVGDELRFVMITSQAAVAKAEDARRDRRRNAEPARQMRALLALPRRRRRRPRAPGALRPLRFEPVRRRRTAPVRLSAG